MQPFNLNNVGKLITAYFADKVPENLNSARCVRAAQAAYRAMGGTDGEWIPLERNSVDAAGISRLLNRYGSKEPAC